MHKKAKFSVFKFLIIKYLTKFCLVVCLHKITAIFSIVDEFCKDFDKTTQPFLLRRPSKRAPLMSKSEVITIYLLFHLNGFRCFKYYYTFYIHKNMQNEFANTVSYNRFFRTDAKYSFINDNFCKNLLFS